MRRRRPIEVLRGVVIELQMAPIKQEVSIGMELYLGIVRSGRTLNEFEFLLQSRAADECRDWPCRVRAAAIGGSVMRRSQR